MNHIRSTRPRRAPAVLVLLSLAGAAGAAGPGRPVGAAADRRFDPESRVFRSTATPPLRLRVPPGFDYLGRLEFPLKGVAWVDRHLFADREGGRARRLIVLQFEGFLDGVDGAYRFRIPRGEGISGGNYRFSPEPVRLGGQEYVHNTWAFDQEKNAAEEPGAESYRTLRFLRERGVVLDAELIISRFVRAVGDDARHELILFYMEPLQASGHRLAEFPDGGPPRPAYDTLSAAVTRRSLDCLHLLED